MVLQLAALRRFPVTLLMTSEGRGRYRFRPLSSISKSEKRVRSSYWIQTCTKPLSPDTLGTYVDTAAEKFGDRVGWAFVQEGKQCTFADFRDQVDRVAQGLLSLGFCKGDTLLIWSPNTFNWILMAAAMAKVGIISASIHFALTAAEFEKCLKTVGFKGLFIAQPFKRSNYYEMISMLIPELRDSKPGQLNCAKYPFLKAVIADGDQKAPGCISLCELMQSGEAELREAQDKVSMDDPFTILFTSGTTGSPKAAALSHHNFVNNVVAYHFRNNFREDMVMCNPLPFFHAYGLSLAVGRPLIYGVKAVVPSPSYDLGALFKAIQEHRCTDISGSPTMYVDMIRSPLLKHYDVSSLKNAVCGGNVVTPSIRKLIRENLNTSVRVGYGATELTMAATVVFDDDPEDKKMHTVGRPLPYLEVKIADHATGHEQPIGTPGEVWCRGHNVFLGYYNDEQKTRECITQAGWYKTGDVGVMDEDGYVTIVSRIKDIVIRGGENVFPAEVEEVINTHPAVHESLVIGVPDDRMGEELCAWIVLKEKANVTDEELRQHSEGKLTRFKIPRYFIYDPKVPRTAVGKAQKAKMRPLAAQILGLTK
ncbi:medium-chain acyl-CoA ligase ACSF2, mitochondrial isoform X10 [Dermacentor silvarum]|uniref:medium-chain acyl-CoA ligase ACSF2, mitochondrial isoform X1 n=1 Tax=Dermacentor silvarum TaxID=543639 RepID=UPI002100E649|nr:medium-chain acyl-CoA ligase ACSF2, mitochondrial isoform X1 [Dermacentor silvarum]XP_049527201.1 medium-chain acyl-CoA ligase ACSF2, mitochondrial isoform X2 [Dermacentor silvarum]XP_049527202.1 medium-chain acyl-CoA ligase ACSF2, mitochondrial isoform X3 [Dermacentor silvarum]XP_049527203.1 medium-chain acyl-CoA ligase ACSF2, mitochondrial isoform X4 [Dermacentor silvarum]XP_049527206.1 medium-chain acyl-CoA ligase ACSF2, mitochondrial isoform X7 [Dermacentor silvarum]XP_049527207.1 mediu